jgi:hypothetical protein
MYSESYAKHKEHIRKYRLANLEKVRAMTRRSMNKLNAYRRQALSLRMMLIDG